MRLITPMPCLVYVYIHTSPEGESDVKHYVVFENDDEAAGEMLEVLVEADTREGLVVVSRYEGSLYPQLSGSPQ